MLSEENSPAVPGLIFRCVDLAIEATIYEVVSRCHTLYGMFVVVHAVGLPMADAVEGAPPTTVVASAVTVAHPCPTDGDTSAAGYVDHCSPHSRMHGNQYQ